MRTYGFLLFNSALLMSEVALAQQAPPAAEQSEAAGGRGFEEVVVTAQRRSQSLTDVPMSVTALSAAALEKAGVSNTSDLQRVTPGLLMVSYSNNLQPTIRGVTANGGNTGDNPSVAMYLDGIYQPQQVAAMMDLPDVEQIEVLKGPQGTLYGQNATGGAIIINTRAPSFTPTGKFSASYGNLDAIDLRGFVSAPMSDTVAVSLSGGYQNRDGFRTHVATGERDSGLDSKLLRAKALFKPTDAMSFTLAGYYSEREDSATFATTALENNSLGYLLVPDAPRVTNSDQYGGRPDSFNRVKAEGGSLRGDFVVDAGTLTVNVGYTHSEVTALLDLDASPVNFVEYHWEPLDAEALQSEATFASRDFGPVSFLAGALYLESEECFCNGRYLQRAPNVPPAAISDPTFQILGRGIVEKKIAAAYAEVSYHVTDAVALTAGGRYTREEQTSAAAQNPAMDPEVPVPVAHPGNPLEWSEFSPRVTARYEVAPGQSIYASYTEGFKGGLINTARIQQKAVDPETIKAYEIGYKGRPTSDLSVTLAAFLYDYSNLQVVALANGFDYITQNAASARGKGAEAGFDWAATAELTLSGAVAYLDARYRDYENAQSFVSTGVGNAPIAVDHGGDRLSRAPEWTASLAANYQSVINAGELGANASLYYTDDYTVDPLGLIPQDSYTTINIELSFSPASSPALRLIAWGKNLTDEAYFAQGQVNEFSTQISWADARTYGLRAEYSF